MAAFYAIVIQNSLKVIFLCGVTFFWFLIRCYIWFEYCPNFICDPFEDVPKEFDYIVVGAGTGGSVLAWRLASDPNTSVLLLEAGPTGGRVLDIPAALPLLQLSPLDWGYKTEPQKNAAKGFVNNVVNWPRGKLIGGTGRFNNMLYVRGRRLDYREWYKNKTDYNYESDILRYYKKSENQIGIYKEDTKHHGSNGPLYVNDIPFTTDLGKATLDAAEYLGYPIRDLNGEHDTGFQIPQANLKNGARYSTGHFLLDNARQNLKIVTNAFVEKVLFFDNFEAKGVKVAKFGSKTNFKARKGVVLSAGAINTPQLLLLSGVGQKQQLKKLKIRQVVDLPVGENLQDHLATGLDLITLKEPLTLNPVGLLSPYTIYDYIVNGKGPWTSIQAEAMGILHTNCIGATNFSECSLNQSKSPDLQIMVLPLGATSDNGAHLRYILGVSDDFWNNYLKDVIGKPALSILPILLKPKSTGHVRLASKDPYKPPIIDPRYLSHPEDIEVLVKGIRLVKKMLGTPSMQNLGATMFEKTVPGCEKYNFDTNDYWKCYITHVTLTVYHPVGTAKMGHRLDATSVVDYDFKVIGVNKLYIADASVMPVITSANTNAPVVLIAEKAADSVKHNDYLNTGTCDVIQFFL